ncbi:MAG: MerR family transcriptional regulator [Agathobacter sp.]|nr:MerR family transcriptional regulator [Agathobacter sp.]
MLIHEAAKRCNITKKAIQYYVEQGLVVPKILENGYSDFSENDIEILKKVSLYRSLDLSVSDVKKVLESKEVLKGILYKRTLDLEREKVKQEILKQVSEGVEIENLEEKISSIDSNSIIIKRLLDMFPSYYGKFISLNFAPYLTGKIETEEQMKAFDEIIAFFDNAPDLQLTPELQEYMDEYLALYSSEDGVEKINSIIQGKQDAMQDINKFVKDNKVVLDEYHKFKQTDAYKNSPAYQLMEVMKEFCATSGYYEVFIPAMRRLSSTYDAYYTQMLKANEEFMNSYPEYCN